MTLEITNVKQLFRQHFDACVNKLLMKLIFGQFTFCMAIATQGLVNAKYLGSQILPRVCPEAGFLVRVHPEPCLILSRAQIRALLCSSKSKFIPA
jgi:hypothetical protein